MFHFTNPIEIREKNCKMDADRHQKAQETIYNPTT